MGINAFVTSYDDFKAVVANLKNHILQGFNSPPGTPAVSIFYFDGGSPYQIVAVTSALGSVGDGSSAAQPKMPIAVPASMIFHEATGTFPASFSTDFPAGSLQSVVQLQEPIRSGIRGWRVA